ncbi:MAG: hypothetical protein WAM58_18570 [Candidatus Acidiferrum sp.]
MKLHDAMRELAKVKFTPEQQAKNLQALREENAKRLKEIERMKAMPDWKAPAPVKPPFVPPAPSPVPPSFFPLFEKDSFVDRHKAVIQAVLAIIVLIGLFWLASFSENPPTPYP